MFCAFENEMERKRTALNIVNSSHFPMPHCFDCIKLISSEKSLACTMIFLRNEEFKMRFLVDAIKLVILINICNFCYTQGMPFHNYLVTRSIDANATTEIIVLWRAQRKSQLTTKYLRPVFIIMPFVCATNPFSVICQYTAEFIISFFLLSRVR